VGLAIISQWSQTKTSIRLSIKQLLEWRFASSCRAYLSRHRRNPPRVVGEAMPVQLETQRSLKRVVPAVATLEGGGFLVHRPLPVRELDQVDPFLLLDELGPAQIEPGQALGAPDHPHKGFEVITYVLHGDNEHRDSHGNRGRLRDGDVQYMAAGSGLVHAEMPSAEFLRDGGPQHGFQIWVNLPRAAKAMTPRYKDVGAAAIPVVRPAAGAEARVIAGDVFGTSGPVHTVTPWTYVHVTLQPGARLAQPVARGMTATIYLFEGVGSIGTRELRRGDYAVFADDGDAIALENTGTVPLQALFLCAQPIGEPMARYGPFVMNTAGEIRDAFEDFRAGRFGAIAPEAAE
jgi:redox-sensitive bicupin YhaK (pirin superfamily)